MISEQEKNSAEVRVKRTEDLIEVCLSHFLDLGHDGTTLNFNQYINQS